MNRLKLSRNNLSYLLHPSIHSKNLARLVPRLPAPWRIPSLSHRSSGAQNGTAKIHFLFSAAFLESEVKWALGSTSVNKASGCDGIPVELFKTLKDDAIKVLHSVC